MLDYQHFKLAVGQKATWAKLTPTQKKERLEKSLLRPDVKEKIQAARRASPKCSGPYHSANVRRAMKRYYALKKLPATIREAKVARKKAELDGLGQ
jgi:hypothetical protein